MKFRKNTEGSALLWAMCATSVLMIIVAAILTMGLTYYNRSVEPVYRKQASLDCRSAIGIASDDIENNGEGSDFCPTEENKLTAEIDLEGNVVTLEIDRRKNGDIRFTAEAEAKNETVTLQAVMKKSGASWKFSGFVSE